MSEQQAMKFGLSTDAVRRITATLSNIVNDFPAQEFSDDALKGLDKLELKQRVAHLISVLADYLPSDFHQAADILMQIKPYWDWGDDNDPLRGFAAWPIIDYVAIYGLEEPVLALDVLKELTPLFSAEFAIRPFIEQHFDVTYKTAILWCDDTDEHIRRLASEGFRPRLPWGRKLTRFCIDPTILLTILELLKDDTSLYVRKSVANNINDIAKDNPDTVIALCQKWTENSSERRQWIIRHGLRTLVKEGREEVFPLLGYTFKPDVNIERFELSSKTILIGDKIQFSTEIRSTSSQRQQLVLDYSVHHVKANGTRTSKVFKWKNITLLAKQALTLSKSHSFKVITTRQYYSGEHVIELLVNGKSYEKKTFELKCNSY